MAVGAAEGYTCSLHGEDGVVEVALGGGESRGERKGACYVGYVGAVLLGGCQGRGQG